MLRSTPSGLKWGIAVLALAMLGGCVSQPRTVVPVSAALSPTTGESPGIRHVMVSVADGDGMVVVNRQPVGLAPQAVEVPVTERGYLRLPMSVGVRFVARDVEEASFSVEEVLEVTDRAPAQLVFSRDKPARRVFATEAN